MCRARVRSSGNLHPDKTGEAGEEAAGQKSKWYKDGQVTEKRQYQQNNKHYGKKDNKSLWKRFFRYNG